MSESKKYCQKFRTAWLQDPILKNWLQAVESTSGLKAKCTACGITLKNHYSDLKNHGNTPRHLEKAKEIISQQKLPFKTVKNNSVSIKKEEARLSLFMAVHSSISLIDHLGTVVNHSHNEETKIKLHRTKCSNIIINVLAPHFFNILREDLQNKSYSLLLDESTDIAVLKYLGIIVIYYSNVYKKIISTYLDLAPLFDANAEGIVFTIKKTLERFNMPIKNLVGIGTDNASVMTGINNGVYAKLKVDIPNLILVRCLCHSIQLAVSAAAKEFLPRNLEFLISETYVWFARSSSRQDKYKKLYNAINDGKNPLKMVQSSQTRWLSIESAVSRIYQQWLELKTHFSIAKMDERCYTAEQLHSMYCDDVNFAFISFIYPILSEVNRVNKLFESKDTDHTKLCDELINLINTLVNKITLPSQKIDIFKQNIKDYIDSTCYLGYRFENVMTKLKEKGLSNDDDKAIRGRCITFIVKLIEELKIRLPNNLQLMKNIKKISVDNALNPNKQPIIDLVTHFNKDEEFIAQVDEQWRQIHLLSWTETNDTKKFWYQVLEYKDAQGKPRFEQLASFAISLLILPHSNADVERLFSSMNVVKNKQRNKMTLPMLTSILLIKAGLTQAGKCCDTYEIPEDIIKKIGTKEAYAVPDEVLIEVSESSSDESN